MSRSHPNVTGNNANVSQRDRHISKAIHLHKGDLPELLNYTCVAIDTETMGLNLKRDRLCVVQLCGGDDICHLVQIIPGVASPRLRALLEDPAVEKLFHYGRFDLASLYAGLGVMCKGPIYCTKIASKLIRTYTDFHGLKTLVRELLAIEMNKTQQSSDWGCSTLTMAQQQYAASDVLYLHRLRDKLTPLMQREGRFQLFQEVCAFLPTRAYLDLIGFSEDIFSH